MLSNKSQDKEKAKKQNRQNYAALVKTVIPVPTRSFQLVCNRQLMVMKVV